jgi:hypothetical protein
MRYCGGTASDVGIGSASDGVVDLFHGSVTNPCWFAWLLNLELSHK